MLLHNLFLYSKDNKMSIKEKYIAIYTHVSTKILHLMGKKAHYGPCHYAQCIFPPLPFSCTQTCYYEVVCHAPVEKGHFQPENSL